MIGSVRAAALAALAGFVLAADSNSQAAPPAPQTAGATATPELQFERPLRWRRVSQETDLFLGGDVRIEAVVSVRDKQGKPLPGESVTLFARSRAGAIARGSESTDDSGIVRVQALFELAVGSLDVDVQACLSKSPQACTPVTPLRLRRWLDPRATLDATYVYYPHVARTGQDVGINLAVNAGEFLGAFQPEMRVALWEQEHRSRHSALMAFGGITASVQHTTASTLFGSRGIETRSGVRSYYAGTFFQARSVAALGFRYVAPVGREGEANGVTQNGKQQPINIADGVSSLDFFASAMRRGETGPPVVFGCFYSLARRKTEGARVLDRGEVGSIDLSMPLGARGSYNTLAPYARFTHLGVSSLTESGSASSREAAVNYGEFGVSYRNQQSGPVGAEVSAFAGGLGLAHKYVGARISFEFRNFLMWK